MIPYDAAATTPTNLGWPDCPGDTTCPGVVSPLAIFPLHATPSGVAATEKYAYVSLFVTGQIQRVELTGETTQAKQTTVADLLEGPHTVMLRPNGQLWVSEHLADRIIALQP